MEPQSAQHIGYVIGVFIGVSLTIGIVALAIVSIVKSFTKKTPGWIIVASITGLLSLFLLGCFAVGFVRGFSQALRAGRETRDESGYSGTAGTQTVKGRILDYSFKVPSKWTIQPPKKNFDVLTSYGTLYIGVIAEEADLGTPENVSNIARKNLSKVSENIHLTDPTPIQMDGRKWLRFTVSCDVQKIPFYYQFYVYAGPEGTYQIVGWTFQNLKEKRSGEIDAVAQSFVFPK